MGKKSVRIKKLNWDVEFITDIIKGDGFIISEPAEVRLDGTKKKATYGPQSPLYGASFSDENEVIERCRCECGAYKGMQYRGDTCPICGHEVKEKGTNIRMTGWLTLGTVKVINPYYYKLLCKLIGKKVFPDIVTIRQKVDRDGKLTILDREKEDDEPLSPYSGIGIENFMKDFDNILEYFKVKKKQNAKELEKLQNMKTSVFTSHIPIYTTKLRPQSYTSDSYYFTTIDKEINPLIGLVDSVNDAQDIEMPFILQRIQERLNRMWEYNFSLMNGKEGFIRDKLVGGSLNYSSRCVICPDPTLHDDEVALSYQAFRILFKYRIIYYLTKLDNMSISKAEDRWNQSFIFDNYIYEIMKFIIKKDDPRVLINRNPTLNYYSMLLVRVRNVKMDDTDYTLSVPLSIDNYLVRSTLNLFNCGNYLLSSNYQPKLEIA